MLHHWKHISVASCTWLAAFSSAGVLAEAAPRGAAEPTPAIRALDPEPAELAPIDEVQGDGRYLPDEEAVSPYGAAEVEVSDTDTTTEVDPDNTEIIRERFPSGAVKIERHIAEDPAGNLVNHGLWTQWDQAGNVVGTGEFQMGQQHGRWVRYLAENEGKMFAAPPYKQFQRPFVSEVTFKDGKLQGTWYVTDARKRPMMQCEFVADQPHGVATWWYANGQKMREVQYRSGRIDGELLEWNPNNQLISADAYKDGRKHTVKVEWYSPGKKKSEGPYLMARQITEESYDWWNATVSTKVIGKEGEDQRHGKWVWWYPNGMKKMEGTFDEGLPHGKFVWWYSNSQKYIEGSYVRGKQDGAWTWWHQNGLTQFKGEYVAGTQRGRWTGYADDGKLVEVQDFTGASAPDKGQQAGEPNPIYLGDDGEPTVAQPRLQALRPAASAPSARRRMR